MPLSLKSNGGGNVSLDAPATASNYTVNIPTTTGIMVAGSSATGALVLPSGSTAQRPSVPYNGATRWNSTLNRIEVFSNLDWYDINSPVDPIYNLTRSLRFRASASAYLTRTPASASNRRTWTLSCWVKRGSLAFQGIFAGKLTKDDTSSFYYASDKLWFLDRPSNVTNISLSTDAVYRDPSAWYHVVLTADTTNATSSDRIKIYVNGNRQTLSGTYPSLNYEIAYINNTHLQAFGVFQDSVGYYFDGYLADTHFIDGQALTPEAFGRYNAITGVWVPKTYTGTYGTNGFYLNFQDNSAATATAIGKDSSGNNNNWTPNNISVTAGVTYDSMTDVPTLTSATAANYAVFNPLVAPAFLQGAVIDNGNLRVTGAGGVSNCFARSTIGISGKMYAEFFFDVVSAAGCIGIVLVNDTASTGFLGAQSTNICYRSGGNKRVLGTETAYGASWVANDIIGVAVDTSANTVEFFKNGTSQGVITSTAFFAQGACLFAIATDDVGSPRGYANFGQRPFTYTPPTGFFALNTYNLS